MSNTECSTTGPSPSGLSRAVRSSGPGRTTAMTAIAIIHAVKIRKITRGPRPSGAPVGKTNSREMIAQNCTTTAPASIASRYRLQSPG
jgi:hypothetical protein